MIHSFKKLNYCIGGDRYNGNLKSPTAGMSHEVDIYVPQEVSRQGRAVATSKLLMKVCTLKPCSASSSLVAKGEDHNDCLDEKCESSVTVRLTSLAKSSGGDKYEGTLTYQSPVTIYIPQCFSRALNLDGEPHLLITFKEMNNKRKIESDSLEVIEPLIKVERSSHSESYEATYSVEAREFIAGAISFEKFHRAIDIGRLDLLGRSPSQHRTYLDFLTVIKGNFATVADFVLANRIGMPTEFNGSHKKYVPRPFNSTYIGKSYLLLNDFPYNVTDDVFHFCLWKIDDVVTDDDIQIGIEKLKSLPRGDTFKFLSYINPPHLKSIPDIDHAHIIVCDDARMLKSQFESTSLSRAPLKP
jgi:hypothetical protein